MKLPYLEIHKRFPLTWGKFNNAMIGKSRYALTGVAKVSTTFDQNSIYPHYNHVEMSGLEASSIISYCIDKNQALKLRVFAIFPQLRMARNLTHDSFVRVFKHVKISLNGASERVTSVDFDGKLSINTTLGGLKIRQTIFTAVDKKSIIHRIDVSNDTNSNIEYTIINTQPQVKIGGVYTLSGQAYQISTKVLGKSGAIVGKRIKQTIAAGESKMYCVAYAYDDMTFEESMRQGELRANFIANSNGRMVITTPDKEINAMTEFCKIRASESIFNTKKGLMHSPGGGGYYAALWTNDQCEYANPMFAYLGYEKACQQSENCYNLYKKYAKRDEAMISSIISCGDNIWHGVGDRGDSSMYLYGLTRYLLTRGDKALALTYMDAIEQCLAYVKSKFNADNIVESDSDELENRFESGKANLCTSIITYDALQSLVYLFAELDYKQKANDVERLLYILSQGIDSYFTANVEGFETYRYCKEETSLRSWICLPLTVGIDSRKDGTIAALMSDNLRMQNGILTRSGEKTYWDRSTLYAMRGMFYVGAVDAGYDLLSSYTHERLLGEHIPYPVEAFPEGNAAQLSAESALYIRIIIEGIVGYRPTGFNSFEIKPNLPKAWENMNVRAIELLGNKVDINIAREGLGYIVTINGTAINVRKATCITIDGDNISGREVN